MTKTAIIVTSILGAMMLTSGLVMILNQNSETPIDEAWTQWKMMNGRSYGTNSEDSYRKMIFSSNYQIVNQKNQEGNSYKLGLNKYADMSQHEFKNTYLGLKPTAKRQENVKHLDTTLLKEGSKDWYADGAVNMPSNQGQCGSCWAFSATGALEGSTFVDGGYLFQFSPQLLVDCATWEKYLNKGCSGGLMDHAFQYSRDNGMMLLADYPYTATDGTCKYDSLNKVPTNTGYTDVPVNDNDQLVAAIDIKPVSVGIAADQIQFYTSGVFDDWENCGDQLDHGVLAVGYGTDSASGKMYWKIKNSWGADWGEAGFFRIERRTGPGEGICGVTKNASYPTN